MIRTISYTFLCMLFYYTVFFKTYRFNYNRIFAKYPIISRRLRNFGPILPDSSDKKAIY